jgi:hypothetical protein
MPLTRVSLLASVRKDQALEFEDLSTPMRRARRLLSRTRRTLTRPESRTAGCSLQPDPAAQRGAPAFGRRRASAPAPAEPCLARRMHLTAGRHRSGPASSLSTRGRISGARPMERARSLPREVRQPRVNPIVATARQAAPWTTGSHPRCRAARSMDAYFLRVRRLPAEQSRSRQFRCRAAGRGARRRAA